MGTKGTRVLLRSLRNKFATVRLILGRYTLKVGGVIVAVEGDICRDDQIVHTYWNYVSLVEAADKINRRVEALRKSN